ncbi:citrate lyase beta subunit [Amycolatopsis bartoniae]|uniref:Aldolase n=1 Tax=Amycolatopsis bartoniae TaxID=941986 RepID=A0A8H9M687_9PSEU|nr:aldolase/citrate lyase family protein [Amycolatopsis bartoniae]MBB2935972.1 citrate lyase beta subunit [Amycolatopsis bartoniae]TVT01133.1 aldolase [Amycolatopsis bartoniae]GHF63185.1 aldolase [Amycolatopsis bartoniae]
MAGRLPDGVYAAADARLSEVDARVAALYPGEPAGRQPVHTVYVPAHRYGPGLLDDWGARARAIFAERGPELGLAPEIGSRVERKLAAEPIEDLRIDFEDGYGNPGDEAEDAAAVSCGRVLAAGEAPPFVGIRFKSFERATRRRGIRTLDLFLGALLDGGDLPPGFVVTLPKVTAVEQVAVAAEVLGALEKAYGLAERSLRFEVQIETSQSIVDASGAVAVPRIIQAADGRCSGLHYGTYDYSAGLGIAAAYQSMEHPAADFAKAFMQVSAAGTGVRLSDGSTNRLPVGESVIEGWREHLRLVRRSLERGFYQGWDLHPHQLPTRFAATYAFFREGFPAAAARLRDYASQVDSGVLDEPATAQALATFLCRGLDCGALDEVELPLPRPRLEAYARRAA